MTRAKYLLFATLLGGLLPVPASAQPGQDAGLVCTVRDASGGVLSSATVTASSPQLIGQPQTTNTDANGEYRFLFLPAGVYEIKQETISTDGGSCAREESEKSG